MKFTIVFINLLLLFLAAKAKPITEEVVSNNFAEIVSTSDEEKFERLNQNIKRLESHGITLDLLSPDVIQDSILSVPDIIEKYGFRAEVHRVQTQDGYILEMHRIVGNLSNDSSATKRQPVFLMHGLLSSSYAWISTGIDNGLAYLLSNSGYDVWMGNARGSAYSRKHISLNPDGHRSERKLFWNFSWHDIGTIDLPTMIDYILDHTQFEKLHYIGHSQGTTTFFVMASEVPEYNSKIISAHALAPIAFMSHLRHPLLRLAASQLNSLQTLANVIGLYEFSLGLKFLQAQQEDCQSIANNKMICSNELFLLTGYNSVRLNETIIPTLAGHAPAGASTNQLIHYGQGIRSGYFRQFDLGRANNLVKYGNANPPEYNLKNIRAPVALYYSDNDLMAEPIDVDRLHDQLPNSILYYKIADYTHLDFIIASDVKTLLYNYIFKTMKKMERV